MLIGKLYDHFFILMTIFFTVYSQLIMRWQVGNAGSLPADTPGKFSFILALLLNPWVLTGVASTFLAGVSWMLAMTRFEISYAFPFVSLNYILILLAGFLIFGESFSLVKLGGTFLVILGLLVIAKG
jgi:drug/metabolite transporter (DMT)-like permease